MKYIARCHELSFIKFPTSVSIEGFNSHENWTFFNLPNSMARIMHAVRGRKRNMVCRKRWKLHSPTWRTKKASIDRITIMKLEFLHSYSEDFFHHSYRCICIWNGEFMNITLFRLTFHHPMGAPYIEFFFNSKISCTRFSSLEYHERIKSQIWILCYVSSVWLPAQFSHI